MEAALRKAFDAFGEPLILKVLSGKKLLLQKNSATADEAAAILKAFEAKHTVRILCPLSEDTVEIQVVQ